MSAVMTQDKALQEAERRWGNRAFTEYTAAFGYRVGYALAIYGRGDSWEAAFVDADQRENGGAQ